MNNSQPACPLDLPTAERLDKELRQKSQASHEWLWQMLQDAVPRLLKPVAGPEAIVFLDNPLEGKEMQALTRLANGFVVYLPPLALLVDPGPDIITRALASGVELQRLNSIFISHPHLDHYAGAEAAIEEMCFLMLIRRGHLLLSEDAARSTVISDFHRGAAPHGGPEQVIVLHPGEPVELLGARLTPVPAYHHGGGCGLILEKNNLRIGYTSDTSYIVSYRASDGTRRTIADNFAVMEDFAAIEDYRHDLKAAYSDVDVLVANVGGHASGGKVEMSALALAHLLRGSRWQVLARHQFESRACENLPGCSFAWPPTSCAPASTRTICAPTSPATCRRPAACPPSSPRAACGWTWRHFGAGEQRICRTGC